MRCLTTTCLAAGLLTLVVLGGFTAQAVPAAGEAAPMAIRAAPDFSRPDLDQGTVHLAALRGKVVLLNFWATWCAPCLAEMPVFARWQKDYAQRGLQVIGISMDDDAAPVRAAHAKNRLNYPVVMGDAPLAESYGGVYGLPVTFLIDRKGRIRSRHQGETDLGALEREIQTLVAEP